MRARILTLSFRSGGGWLMSLFPLGLLIAAAHGADADYPTTPTGQLDTVTDFFGLAHR